MIHMYTRFPMNNSPTDRIKERKDAYEKLHDEIPEVLARVSVVISWK